MKYFILSLICVSGVFSRALSQSGNIKFAEVDKSPMDMSYFPVNYPILKIQNKISGPPAARIIYGRPHRQGRKVFGELVEYGKIWRFGANEATEIEFFKDVKIERKKVSKGRYTLFALVEEKAWTIILNKDTDVWGSFKYDSSKDILRVELPVQKISEVIESLSMIFEPDNSGMKLVIAWEQSKVILPISF